MDRFKRKNNLSIVPSSSVIEKIESEEITARGRGRPCKMSPSENIYIHDVRPISDSVATCRSQPMKNDHVTTMEPPRGESSLSRERKTRQLVRCEWTINIGSRQTTWIEGNRRDGKKVVRDTSSVWQENAQFLSCNIHRRCYCHREAAVMTDDDARAFLFTLDILRTYTYIYIYTYILCFSIRVVWISTLRRFVSRFVSRCSTRNCLE